jgi:transposase
MEDETMARRVLPKLEIADADRERLVSWTRRQKTGQALALRSRIILACAEGHKNIQVAKQERTTNATVGKWRQRYVEFGIDGLMDEPRPGAPRTISDKIVEEIVTKTLESQPAGMTHWSTREMSKNMGVSRESVRRVWQAFRLKPHREGTFKISKDPLLVDKVRDIVGLYLNPPERALVLSVDEKSQIQALDRTQTLLPMQPGRMALRTHDYKRHGTTSLFAALDVATGKVIGTCMNRHRSKEFISFLDKIDASVPNNLDVHLILDNYSTHKTPAVKRWLNKHPRFHQHFTPTRGSWLNQVERWFSGLSNKALRRSVHRSVKELISAIDEYVRVSNATAKPYRWMKTATEILDSMKRFCDLTLSAHLPRTSVSGH